MTACCRVIPYFPVTSLRYSQTDTLTRSRTQTHTDTHTWMNNKQRFYNLSITTVMYWSHNDTITLQKVLSASEMTYIVSSGALNSTHSLTHSLTQKVLNPYLAV